MCVHTLKKIDISLFSCLNNAISWPLPDLWVKPNTEGLKMRECNELEWVKGLIKKGGAGKACGSS